MTTKQFYFQPHPAINRLSEYFDFNRLPYEKTDIWDNDSKTFALSTTHKCATQSVLVLRFPTFGELIRNPVTKKDLFEFINNNNKIWLWQQVDSLLCLDAMGQSVINHIDDSITPGAITAFIDGLPSDRHWILKLKNIKIKSNPVSQFCHMLRIQNARVDKLNPRKDFMFTVTKKKTRPHREYLWKELVSRPGLIDKGHVTYKPRGSLDNWLGSTSHPHGWFDGCPSMDLYTDSWLELFPETLGKDFYYITEKTIKPMVTKTPFLVLSTCYYLEYLKSNGFKTFHGIIDERYDRQYRVQDRAKLVVDLLEDIIRNGTKEFYQACQPILEHNYLKVAEISGVFTHKFDCFIEESLAEIGFSG